MFTHQYTGVNLAGQPWFDRSTELAAWVWEHMVNRTDVWGGYHAFGDRKRLGPTCTRPNVRDRGSRLLDIGDIERHFRAGQDSESFAPRWVVGLHSTSPDSTCLWPGIDIDWHGPSSTAAEVNWSAALAWYERLISLGIVPILTDSNGKGGFHLVPVLASPITSVAAFNFAGWLVQDYQAYGMTAPPEAYPKQANLDGIAYGSWLRLFGRHHTRDHWSRVWNGSRWLEGNDAIDYILSIKPNDPNLIPSEALTFNRLSIKPARSEQRPTSSTSHTGSGAGGSRASATTTDPTERRIRAYMDHLPHLGEGQGRDGIAFGFAGWLVRDMGLTDAEALPWLSEWDAGNSPPKGDARLQEIIRNVHRYGRASYGSGIDRPYTPKPPAWLAEIADIPPNSPLEIYFGETHWGTWGGDGVASVGIAPPAASSPPPPMTPEERAALTDANRQYLDLQRALEAQQQAEIEARVIAHQQKRRTHCQLCPRCAPTVQARRDGSGGRTIHVGCDRYDCAVCCPLNVDRWKLNFQLRIQNEVFGPMWEFWCPASAWDTVRRGLRRAGGKFFRCTGTDMVYATVPPSASAAAAGNARQLDKADALARLCLYVETAAPTWTRGHIVTASHGWKFPVVECGRNLYVNVGGAPGGPNAIRMIRDVLAAHGLNDEGRVAKSIFGRIRYAIEFTWPAWWGEDRKKRLFADLALGEYQDAPDGPFEVWWGDAGDGGGGSGYGHPGSNGGHASDARPGDDWETWQPPPRDGERQPNGEYIFS